MGLRKAYYLKRSFDTLGLSGQRLEEFQVKRMEEVRAAAEEVSPYQERWDEVPSRIEDERDMEAFPVMSPDEFPRRGMDAARVIYTSGTRMRRPVAFDRTGVSWLAAVQMRTHFLQGYRPFRKMASYWDEKPEQSLLGRLFFPVRHVPSTLSIVEQAEMLAERQPRYLHYFPQVLFSVAKYMERSPGEVGVSPDAVFTHGELLTDHMRDFIEETFDTRVMDQYGTTEFGVAAWECPEGDGYHLSEDLVYPEVVDSGGNRVEEGVGDLVLTTLANRETPLFRHRIGDVVELSGGGCGCGTSFRKISRIRGRRRGVIVNDDGGEVYPDEVIDELSHFHDLLAFQLKRGEEGFVLTYVPNTGFDEGVRERVVDALGALGIHPVRMEEKDGIERVEGGKIPVIRHT